MTEIQDWCIIHVRESKLRWLQNLKIVSWCIWHLWYESWRFRLYLALILNQMHYLLRFICFGLKGKALQLVIEIVTGGNLRYWWFLCLVWCLDYHMRNRIIAHHVSWLEHDTRVLNRLNLFINGSLDVGGLIHVRWDFMLSVALVQFLEVNFTKALFIFLF